MCGDFFQGAFTAELFNNFIPEKDLHKPRLRSVLVMDILFTATPSSAQWKLFWRKYRRIHPISIRFNNHLQGSRLG
jgi:hypothetical protein